jgi:plastocyanin domain-containing protein
MKSRMLWLAIAGVAMAGCGGGVAGGSAAPGAVAIRVTEKGFEPAVVMVAAGKPVTLRVTRRTDRTCAKEFVLAELDIRRELPLDQPVEITFTPAHPGELRYACGMDMIAGKIVVR